MENTDLENSKPHWSSEFRTKSWIDILSAEPQGLVSSYQLAVSLFAETLKNSIVLQSDSDENSTSASLELLVKRIPEFISSHITLQPGADEVLDMPPLVKLHESLLIEKKKSAEDILAEQEKHQEDNEQLFTNLFQRVYDIFTADGKSLNELFQILDVNKDGKISSEELRAELLRHDKSITKEECEAVFEILDGNQDGVISLDEIMKRVKLVKEKADMEAKDPLAHIVISKPLDPKLIHGNLAVMLLKGQGLKQGSHLVKLRVKNSLEYVSPDTIEQNPLWNFRCDFFFENYSPEKIPSSVEFDLYNKGKIEGSGSFLWQSCMKMPNEFSLKHKIEVKTKTGQFRGNLYFQLQWTPIIVKEATPEELEKLEHLRSQAEEYKKAIESINKIEGGSKYEEDKINMEEEFLDGKLDIPMGNAQLVIEKPGAYIYVVKKSMKIVEKVIIEQKKTQTHSGLKNRESLNASNLKNAAASKIQGVWRAKKK